MSRAAATSPGPPTFANDGFDQSTSWNSGALFPPMGVASLYRLLCIHEREVWQIYPHSPRYRVRMAFSQ